MSIATRRHVSRAGRTRKKKQHKKRPKKGRAYSKSEIIRLLGEFEGEVAIKFLEILHCVKLYHWKTYSFATHKATDELHEKLSANTDRFMEVLLGKVAGLSAKHHKEERITLPQHQIPLHNSANRERFKEEINDFKTYLVELDFHDVMLHMNNGDLYTIRDEMLADLNQFLYLYTFK